MSDKRKFRTGPEDKRHTLEVFIQFGMGMLHLDARVPGVRVPSNLQNNFQLRLNVSPRFNPPDLVIDDWGVRQTLSFGGCSFPVSIPWEAIYGLSNVEGQMRLYPLSIPDEIFNAVGSVRDESAPDERIVQVDDGSMPVPVVDFEPKMKKGKPTLVSVPSVTSGPRPVMMRRKGGLGLVAPPESEEETTEAKPEASMPVPDAPESHSEAEIPSTEATPKRTEKKTAAVAEEAQEPPEAKPSKAKKTSSKSKKKIDDETKAAPPPPKVTLRIVK